MKVKILRCDMMVSSAQLLWFAEGRVWLFPRYWAWQLSGWVRLCAPLTSNSLMGWLPQRTLQSLWFPFVWGKVRKHWRQSLSQDSNKRGLFFSFWPHDCGMHSLSSPNQESNLCPLQWKHKVWTTGPQGSPQRGGFNYYIMCSTLSCLRTLKVMGH